MSFGYHVLWFVPNAYILLMYPYTQDTVIAMQALSQFSEVTFTSQLNKSVTFDIQGLTADPLTVNDENRFERKEYEVCILLSSYTCSSCCRG